MIKIVPPVVPFPGFGLEVVVSGPGPGPGPSRRNILRLNHNTEYVTDLYSRHNMHIQMTIS
jgi:hypothetical protein